MKRFVLSLIFVIGLICVEAQNSQVQTIIQKGHGEAIKALAVSHDGQFLATGSRDRTIKLWDLISGHEIRTYFGHEHTVNDLAFSTDDKRLVSSSADNTARVWDVSSGKQLWQSPKTQRYLTSVAFHPSKNWIAVAGYDSPMKVWDWKKNEVVKELKVAADMGTGYGVDVNFNAEGTQLAIGQDNRLLQLVSTSTWEELQKIQPEEGWCGGCGTYSKFSPDGTVVVKASNRDGFRAFDTKSGKLITTYREEIDDLASVDVSNDGKLAMLATSDSLLVFELNSGKLYASWKQNGKEVNEAVLLSADELIVGDDDGRAYVWDLKHGNKPTEYVGTLNDRDYGGVAHDLSDYWNRHIAHHLKYKNEQVLVDNKGLLKGKLGSHATLWDLKSGQTTLDLGGHEKAVISIDYDASKKEILTGGGDGAVILWSVFGKEKLKLEKHRDPVFDVVFSHNGKYIASACWGGRVLIWERESGELYREFYFTNVAAYTIEFSQNDEYLIMGMLDKTLQVWDIDSETKVQDFIGHTDIVTSIELGPDPMEFSTTARDGRYIQWHLGFGLKRRKVTHPQGAVHCQAYWEQQGLWMTAGEDRVIRIWNRDLSSVQQELVGHYGEVTSLNISDDGQTLYSLDLDGVTKIWDLTSFEEKYEFMQLSRADWLIKSPEGYFSGTEKAMKQVHFVKGMKSYALDQFFDNFYQPKVISKLLEIGHVDKSEGINDFFDKNTPPEVKIAGFANSEKTRAKIYVKLRGKGIKEMVLKHNGKRLPISLADLTTVEKKEGFAVYATSLPLIGGHNEFSCRAINKIGVASAEAKVDVLSEQPTSGTDCYVLAVGIDHYKNKALNLNYAKADAQSFSDSLAKYGKGIYRNVHQVNLFDKGADREHVLSTLDSLAKVVTLNDVFVFYFAGHGTVVDEHFFFVTHESTRLHGDNSEMRSKAIPDDEMMQAFQGIKALKQIILMDACQSGGAVELLASRGAMEEKAIAQLSRSAGVHVLAAAGSEQFATEYAKLGHGIFTYSLLEGLRGLADGAPQDGKVTMFEVKSYLDDQVPTLSQKYKGKAQYPYTFSRGHDFPIGVVK